MILFGRTRRLLMAVAALAFAACGCSSTDGNGGEPVDVAGVWNITETYLTDTCEGGGGSDTYQVTITQNGNAVTLMYSDGDTVSGTINGNKIQYSGSYDEEGGTMTVSAEFTVSADGRSMQGTDSWSWTNGSMNCSGTDSFSGTRETGGGNGGGGNGGGGNGGGGNGGGDGGTAGDGGAGGSIGPLTWVSSNLTIVPTDGCEFFSDSRALTFEMTIQGSTLTLVESSGMTVSTDEYMETDDEVTVAGLAEDSSQDPCLVELDDAMQLGLDDPDVRIDQNDTLSVTWNHAEAELSTDECQGVWWVDLPCSGVATLTLTQSPAP